MALAIADGATCNSSAARAIEPRSAEARKYCKSRIESLMVTHSSDYQMLFIYKFCFSSL
jgi:hypothetical protein